MSLTIRLTAALSLALSFSACNTDLQSADDATAEAALVKFDALTRSERLATYEALSSNERVSLWRAQLNRVLNEEVLTSEQRTSVLSAREALPQILAGKDQSTLKRLETSLGEEAARALLADLGRPAPIEKTRQAFYGGRGGAVQCNTTWCLFGLEGETVFWDTANEKHTYICHSNCNKTNSGCGNFWMNPCVKYDTWSHSG
jgi:hypothetical protein